MTNKIEKLTKEQEAKFPFYVKKWLGIGHCTLPANRSAAEEGAVLAYKTAGLPPPTRFFWFNSPHQAVLVLNKLLSSPGVKYNSLNDVCYGQHEAGSLSFYDFFARECGLEVCNKLEGINQIAENCGWAFMYPKAVVFTERPTSLHLDDRGRIHNTKGPSWTYKDGSKSYNIHDIQVKKEDITKPMTLKRIQSEFNIEVRRVLIDLMGLEKYLKASKAKKIDHDLRFGTLFKVEQKNDEPIVTAMVVNSSPEPDGSFKKYFLRVPPTMTSIKEAIKWTFPALYASEDYSPEVET